MAWTGTTAIGVQLAGKWREVRDWFEVYRMLAEALLADGHPIPPEFIGKKTGRRVFRVGDQYLNVNLRFDDLVPRIRRLAEILKVPCRVAYTREGSPDRFEEVFYGPVAPPQQPTRATTGSGSRVLVIVVSDDVVRNEPEAVLSALRAAAAI